MELVADIVSFGAAPSLQLAAFLNAASHSKTLQNVLVVGPLAFGCLVFCVEKKPSNSQQP